MAAIGLAAPPAGEGNANFLGSFLVPMLLMGVMFYFLLIAPQRKRAKEHAALLASLKSGDRVVTTSGIHGTVEGVDDHVVHLRVAPQVKLEIDKSAVAGRREAGS